MDDLSDALLDTRQNEHRNLSWVRLSGDIEWISSQGCSLRRIQEQTATEIGE